MNRTRPEETCCERVRVQGERKRDT